MALSYTLKGGRPYPVWHKPTHSCDSLLRAATSRSWLRLALQRWHSCKAAFTAHGRNARARTRRPARYPRRRVPSALRSNPSLRGCWGLAAVMRRQLGGLRRAAAARPALPAHLLGRDGRAAGRVPAGRRPWRVLRRVRRPLLAACAHRRREFAAGCGVGGLALVHMAVPILALALLAESATPCCAQRLRSALPVVAGESRQVAAACSTPAAGSALRLAHCSPPACSPSPDWPLPLALKRRQFLGGRAGARHARDRATGAAGARARRGTESGPGGRLRCARRRSGGPGLGGRRPSPAGC